MAPQCWTASIALFLACGGKPGAGEPEPAALANTHEESCRDQAAALKTYMRDLFEGGPVSAPWATGDPVLDEDIRRRRNELRELSDPDPNRPAPPLTGERKPGPIDHELASCPAATEQLAKVGDADDKLAAWVGIADAIATCGCRPRIAYLKPLFYLLLRGPD